jgi:PEGA domain-containing protein
VNPRVLIVAVVVGVFVAGAAYLVVPRRPVSNPAPGATTATREAAPAPSAPATPEAPAPATPRAGAPRAPRRPSAEPAPAPAAATELGTLRIAADVPGAQVFLDRQFLGVAPVTAENVKPGTHQLNVTAEGFDGIAQSIDIEPGPRDLTVRFKEVRLNAALAVVHKHRMGSCTGQLLATPQGLRYETSDNDDRFVVPLRDLEVFTVDYQDKNLRVKVRKGKQYNFTDPDGNSDRLFVFHREVEKVRQRLVQGGTSASD